jgi:hypothetical protein
MRIIALDKVAYGIILASMSSKCDFNQRQKVDIPFTVEEAASFRSFLKSTGRKAGPWMRLLAIRAMDMEKGIGDGSGQARELAEAIEAAR